MKEGEPELGHLWCSTVTISLHCVSCLKVLNSTHLAGLKQNTTVYLPLLSDPSVSLKR